MSVSGLPTFGKSLSAGIILFAGVVSISGCGGGGEDRKAVAKVTGKVTHNGAPVTGGQILFSPVGDPKKPNPGKTGMATVKSDGTYSVSTYGTDDGACIGQNRVSFSAPPPATGPHGEPQGEAKFTGLTPSKDTVEVKSGANTVDIELVPIPGSTPAQ